jgi:EF-P beta-lysylation protein EpmB
MIPRTDPSWQSESTLSWQQQLQSVITEPDELLRVLELDPKLTHAATLASRQFPLRVPHAFVDRMERGNLNDPLLMQVLPIQQELIAQSGYSADPLLEQGNQQAGLIQKYHGRVLLLVNGHCAINCRYCFRRHFPYEENRLNKAQWLEVIEQITSDSTVEEVIYSGGDPLASSDRQLHWLTQKIAAIPHIKRLRIHSRLPVVIPDRINAECIDWLTQHNLQTVFVLHINHPNEIDQHLQAAIKRLKDAGNDSAGTLKALSDQLFASGVLPYYLHLFDPVAGAAHFDVPLTEAKKLHDELLTCLPGYLVPKLVKEIAGEGSKTPV